MPDINSVWEITILSPVTKVSESACKIDYDDAGAKRDANWKPGSLRNNIDNNWENK